MREWRRLLEARIGDAIDASGRDAIIDELGAHFDERARELLAEGRAPDEADRIVRAEIAEIDPAQLARRRFAPALGTPPRRRFSNLARELGSDLLHGVRQFRHQRLYAFACAATLALAVATSTASFAILKRAFLDPLPYADDASLFTIETFSEGRLSSVSVQVLEDLRASNSPFSGFAPIRPGSAIYAGPDGTQTVGINRVTAEYFETIGVRPAIGGAWRDGDRHAVVISHEFWQTALSAKPAVVGASISIDGVDHVIAGVMPHGYVAPPWGNADLWAPLDVQALLGEIRTRRQLTLIARARDVSRDQVNAYLGVFTDEMQRQHPSVHARQSWVATPLRLRMIGDVRASLVGVSAAAALLLLVVGANVAGLSAARAVSLRRDRAIRLALGATRGRLLRARLAEGLVIAAAGSSAGLLLARALVAIIGRNQAQFLPRLAEISLDAGTLAAGMAAGLVAGVVAVMLPQGGARDAGIADPLRGARGSTGDRAGATVRSSLVVVQVALALVLIVGAGLLVRTVRHLAETALGFPTGRLTVMQVSMPGARYATAAQQIQFERDVIERLESLPGVTSASAGVGFPIMGGMGAGLRIFGAPLDEAPVEIGYMSVSPNLLPSVGVPLVEGRHLQEGDTDDTQAAFVINETLARLSWPAGDAVGSRVYVGPGVPSEPEEWGLVVGIVGDVRQFGPAEPVRPTAYGSTRQFSWPRRHFAVRTSDARPSLPAELRAVIRDVDPALAVGMVREIDEFLADQTSRHHLAMGVLTFFGTVSLVLCGFGLYAVVALTSQVRRREYAVRMALGAPRGDVRWMVIRQALRLAAAGIAAGIGVAAVGTRALQSLLHGVTPVDAATFGGAAVVVLMIATLAAWMPARRAGRVDPVEALKAE